MKKATIVTIYDPLPNFGNRLQNYAAQTYLESLGLQVNTLSFEKKILTRKKCLKHCINTLSGYRLSKDTKFHKYTYPRMVAFDKFNKKYIKTEEITALDQIAETDFYVLGSDQVWNTEWYWRSELKKDLFLLTFVKPEQKVCFSPSFGVTILPDEWVPWFSKYLSQIPMLGVREESGRQIIKNLTGMDSVVTLDPTLMLNPEDWRKLASKPSKIDCDKNYILTYFVGGQPDNAEHDSGEFSGQLNAVVYNLIDMEQPMLYTVDPAEFIYLVDHAQLILTDSFHACVFSFLFGKPFQVYTRVGNETNLMSRIYDLLDMFDLRRKYVDSGLENDLLECDYSNGYKTLELERKKTLQFLKDSMHLQ